MKTAVVDLWSSVRLSGSEMHGTATAGMPLTLSHICESVMVRFSDRVRWALWAMLLCGMVDRVATPEPLKMPPRALTYFRRQQTQPGLWNYVQLVGEEITCRALDCIRRLVCWTDDRHLRHSAEGPYLRMHHPDRPPSVPGITAQTPASSPRPRYSAPPLLRSA